MLANACRCKRMQCQGLGVTAIPVPAFRGRDAVTTGGLLVFGTESTAAPVLRWCPLTRGMLDGLSPVNASESPSRWCPGVTLLLLLEVTVGTLEAEGALFSTTWLPLLLPAALAGVLLRRPHVSVKLQQKDTQTCSLGNTFRNWRAVVDLELQQTTNQWVYSLHMPNSSSM